MASIVRFSRMAFSAAAILAAAAGSVGVTGAAQGQIVIRATGGGPFMGGPGGGASISKSALDRYEKLLGMTAEQKDTAAALHETYLADSQAVAKEQRDAMQAARESISDGDFSALGEKMAPVMRKSGEKRAALDKGLLSDLKSLLTPEQATAWPRLERLRRREQWLQFGMVSGAGVDLTTVVDALKLPDEARAKIRDTVEDYEQQMDRLLAERENAAKEEQSKREAAGGKGGDMNFDMEAMQARMKKDREESVKLRDLNQRYARLISSLLPDDAKARFAEDFKTRSFRQIYSESSAAKRLAAAEKFDDLTAEQRQQLKQIGETYQNQIGPLNDRWAAALEQAESDGSAGGFPMMFAFGDDGPGAANGKDTELSTARKARRDLDKKTSDQVNSVLTDAQKERLPKPRQGGPGTFTFGGGDDGGDAVLTFTSVDTTDDGNGMAVHSIMIGGPGGGDGGAAAAPAAKPKPADGQKPVDKPKEK